MGRHIINKNLCFIIIFSLKTIPLSSFPILEIIHFHQIHTQNGKLIHTIEKYKIEISGNFESFIHDLHSTHLQKLLNTLLLEITSGVANVATRKPMIHIRPTMINSFLYSIFFSIWSPFFTLQPSVAIEQPPDLTRPDRCYDLHLPISRQPLSQ